MGDRLQLVIEVDDRGTATVRQFSRVLEREVPAAAAKAEQGVERFTARTSAGLERLSRTINAVAGVSATLLGGLMVRSIVRTGIEFEKSMSGVRAISGATGESFRALSEQARKLGATTVFTAVQAAHAQEKLALAGFQVREILASMPKVLSLAAAGELDVAEAASIASDVIRGLGIAAADFGKAADAMAWAATNSNQTIGDLGQAIKYVAPVARATGTQIDELAGALAVLANRGIRADMAGTALRRGLSVMIGNLEAGEKGLAKFGVRLTDARGNFVGLTEAIRRMKEANLSASQVMEAFGQRAGPAMLALMQAGSDTLEEYSRRAAEAAGLTERIAGTRLDNLAGDLQLLRSAWEGLSVTLMQGQAPALREVVQGLTRLVNQLDELAKDEHVMRALVDSTKLLGQAFAGLLALQVGVSLKRWVTNLSAAVGATRALQVNVAALTAEVGALGTALRVATPVLAAFWAGWKVGEIISEVTGLGEAIRGLSRYAADYASMSMEDVAEKADSALTTAQKVAQQINSLQSEYKLSIDVDFDAINKFQQKLVDALDYASLGNKGAAIGALQEAMDRYGEAVTDAARKVGQLKRELAALEKAHPGLAEKLRPQVKSLEDLVARMKEGGKALEDQAQQAAQATAEATKALVKGLIKAGVIVGPAFEKIAEDWGALWKAAKVHGIDAATFAKVYQEDLAKLDKALSAIQKHQLAPGLREALRLATQIREQAEAAKEAAKAHEQERRVLEGLEEQLLRMGIVSQEAADRIGSDLVAKFNLLVAHGYSADEALQAIAGRLQTLSLAARNSGVELSETVRALAEVQEASAGGGAVGPDPAALMAHREEIERLVTAYQLAGEEIPEQIAEWQAQIEELEPAENLLETMLRVKESFREMTQGVLQGIGDAVAGAIVEGENLSESLKSLAKQTLKAVISMLVQLALAHLLWGKAAGKAVALVDAQRLAGSLANVYTNTYASIAAIPIVGPGMAPGAAAAAVKAAESGAKAAMAAGAALASQAAATQAKPTAMAEGGIVQRPTFALIGEAGPEAVIPLRGPRARKATEQLGIGGTVIENVNLIVEGSLVAEEGWEEQLIDTIHEGLRDAIESGRLESL